MKVMRGLVHWQPIRFTRPMGCRIESVIISHLQRMRRSRCSVLPYKSMVVKSVIDIKTGYRPLAYLLEDPNWCPGRSGAAWQRVTSAGLGKPEPVQDTSLHAGNVAACVDLLAAIQEDRLPECNMFEARTTVEMIAGVFESHRQSVPVTIPLKHVKNPLTLTR